MVICVTARSYVVDFQNDGYLGYLGTLLIFIGFYGNHLFRLGYRVVFYRVFLVTFFSTCLPFSEVPSLF